MRVKAKKRAYVSLFGGTLLCVAACFLASSHIVSANADEKIIIDVDTLSYNVNILPKGVEGKSYPVFDCTAVDGDGNEVKDIDVTVYNPAKELLAIKDNRFDTPSVGKYSIVYKATKGKVEEKMELVVTVVEQSNYTAPYYTFSDEIVSSSYTGEQVLLYDGVYGGGNGELTLSCQLAYEGAYTAQEAKIENFGVCDYFLPTAEGKYTVKYSVTDIVGETVSAQKEIVVTDSSAPIMRQPVIATSGVVGQKISFENTEAIVYVDGKEIYVPVKVYVGDTEVTSAMSYTPESKGAYTVRYEAVNPFAAEQNLSKYEQEVQVVDLEESEENKLPFIENYFKLDGMEGFWRAEPENTADKQEGLEYDVYVLKADGSAADVSAAFATKLPVQYASMRFGVDDLNAAFGGISLAYVDSVNGEQKISIELKKNVTAATVDVYVSGKYKASIKSESYIFCFEVDEKTGVLTETVSGTEICRLSAYDNGKEFVGFESRYVYLCLAANAVDSNFGFKLYEISTLNVNGSTYDNGKPLFIDADKLSSILNVEFGAQLQLQGVSAFDLYSTEVQVTAKVTSPSGIILYNEAVTEDSVITLTEHGDYKLVYRAVDASGNYREIVGAIIITDRYAPIMSEVSLPTTVKVGETVTFPEATVTDNATEEVVSWIYVTTEDYQKLMITKGQYTFKKAGTYLVKYGAEDESGNITVITYTVVCK